MGIISVSLELEFLQHSRKVQAGIFYKQDKLLFYPSLAYFNNVVSCEAINDLIAKNYDHTSCI